jgi:hypothetical protein
MATFEAWINVYISLSHQQKWQYDLLSFPHSGIVIWLCSTMKQTWPCRSHKQTLQVSTSLKQIYHLKVSNIMYANIYLTRLSCSACSFSSIITFNFAQVLTQEDPFKTLRLTLTLKN